MTDDAARLPWFRLMRSGGPVAEAAPSRSGPSATAAAVLPSADTRIDPTDPSAQAAPCLNGLVARAGDASTLLKALGHDGRLTILCHLARGEKGVTELENLLSSRQAIVSQQLARLRLEGLVSTRREGQAIFYSILDPKVIEVLTVLGRLYAAADNERR